MPSKNDPSRRFSVDSSFWRRLAHWGSANGPRWFIRATPSVVAAIVAVCVPRSRAALLSNVRRVRGPQPPLDEARDVLSAMSAFAGALTEALTHGSKNAETPTAKIYGDHHLRDAIARGKGVLLVTAHTPGWDVLGPLLGRDHGLEVTLVMEAEPDAEARAVSDDARKHAGYEVVHVGDDAMSALSLLGALRRGRTVALQMDRVPPGSRTRGATLFGTPFSVAEGPLRLAQLSGAAIVPVFCAREAFRSYHVEVNPPIVVDRRADEAALDGAARELAGAFERFLTTFPTQWVLFPRS